MENRLSIVNKQLLIGCISKQGLYEVICNNFLRYKLVKQCRLLCFAFLVKEREVYLLPDICKKSFLTSNMKKGAFDKEYPGVLMPEAAKRVPLAATSLKSHCAICYSLLLRGKNDECSTTERTKPYAGYSGHMQTDQVLFGSVIFIKQHV